jgi:hypothetical protein
MIKYVLFIFGSFFLSASIFAHHGIRNFDHDSELRLSGTITDLAFVNPHSWIYFDVTAEDGGVSNWRCEMRAATALRRSGWSPEIFTVGKRIEITASPERDGSNTCYMSTIVFEDGLSLNRYGQIEMASKAMSTNRPYRLANGDVNISGDWAAEQFVLSDPTGVSGAFLPLSVAQKLEPGEVPEGAYAFPGTRGAAGTESRLNPGAFPSPVEVTEAGAQAALKNDDLAAAYALRLDCRPTNIAYDWTFDFHVNRIVQEDDRILLNYGFMDIQRTLYMDMETHPADIEPSLGGHSIGHWEDDVLIVDTIGFVPSLIQRQTPQMFSEQLHVVERFSLNPDDNVLTREYVAVDPGYVVGEFKGVNQLQLSEVPYHEYNCDDRTEESTPEISPG